MLTQERLKELVDYNPDTGVFTRKLALSNRTKAGAVMGSLKDTGYLRFKIDNVDQLAHRMAWLYVKGSLPPFEIDHRDRDRTNNAIDNLREATPLENNRNQSLRSSNTSGYKGVTFNKNCGRWFAKIGVNGVRKHIGSFSTAELAYAAYCECAKELFGEFYSPAQKEQIWQ